MKTNPKPAFVTHEGKILHFRTKRIKLIATPEFAEKLLNCLILVGTSLLATKTSDGLPTASSVKNGLRPAKALLAAAIEMKTFTKVDPDSLSAISFSMMPTTGYFEVSVTQTTPGENGTCCIRPLNITFMNASGKALIYLNDSVDDMVDFARNR